MKVSISHCKLLKKRQKQLLQFFVAEVTARTASNLVGINRRTGTLYYQKIREVVCDHLKQEVAEYFEGEVELDESYFGGRRKGKRGRGGRWKSDRVRDPGARRESLHKSDLGYEDKNLNGDY